MPSKFINMSIQNKHWKLSDMIIIMFCYKLPLTCNVSKVTISEKFGNKHDSQHELGWSRAEKMIATRNKSSL